jgi:DNA-binding transcriptional MerR regulator
VLLLIFLKNSKIMTLKDLVNKVNAWCDGRGIAPASGQSARNLSERTLRYYRTLGLLDPPEHGGGDGYGEKHRLQLVGIRILQNQGLPLNRAQTLLYGRTVEELRSIAEHTDAAGPLGLPTPRAAHAGIAAPCPGYSLGDGFYLVCGNGKSISQDRITAIRKILGLHPQDVPTRHTPNKKER